MTTEISSGERSVQDPPRTSTAEGARGSRMQTLTLGEVVATAVALVDADGLEKFTMGKLGQRLGVEAMALYHYVSSRESLLDAIVEHVVDELYGDPLVHLQAEQGWAVYQQHLTHGVRRTA